MLCLAATDTIAGVAGTAAVLTYTFFGMELAGGVETYKGLAQGQFAAAAATLYTAPAATQTFIKTITVVNTSAAAVGFILYRNGTGAGNQISSGLQVPAFGTATWEDGSGWVILDQNGQLVTAPTLVPTFAASLTADGPNQTSTVEAVLASLAIPANFCNVGTSFGLEFALSCAQGAVAQTTPGMVYNLRWGTTTAGVLIATVGIITPATLLAASPGFVRAMVTIRTLGAAGTAKGGLSVSDPRGTRVASGEIVTKAGRTGAAAAVIDTTTAQGICLTSKSTIADAACITFAESAQMWLAKP